MSSSPTALWPAISSRESAAPLSVQHHHERPSQGASCLHQLVESAGVGLLHARGDGIIQLVNPRAAAMLGHPPQALIGLHLLDLVHPADAASLQARVEQVMLGNSPGELRDLRCLMAGGGVAHLSLHLHPTFASSPDDVTPGAINGLALVLDDVSERVHMAEVLGSARDAVQASRAKTEFLSRMSHELRTPLNAMLGFAQLLRVDPRFPLADAQRQKVDHIERAGAHLLAMMTDVLDLSRIEAGSLPMSLQPVAVGQIVDEALNLVNHQAMEARLQLSSNVAEPLVVHPGLAPPPLAVRADPVRLRQVLVNLLSNAIKYNRPGGRVMLEAMPVNDVVMFNVTDTGPGLHPEQVSHLFEPFNRLGAERTSVEGTGIGLVIVKRLIDLMEGRLDVSSALGTGSSFKVWLAQTTLNPDAARPVAPAANNPPPRDLPQPQGEHGGPHRSVLYAEDNMINVELVRQVMRMRPHWHLDVALCGQQAIDMARQNPPDLLLLDMHLGDMSGLDVSDALANHPATCAIPRVALSADAMPDQISEARTRGFVDYLTKPLDVARLLGLLDQLAFPPVHGVPPH